MKMLLIVLLAAAPVLACLAFFANINIPVYVSQVSAVSDGTSAGTHVDGQMLHYTKEVPARSIAVAGFVCDVLAIIAVGIAFARTRRT